MRALQITELSGPATALQINEVPEPPREHPMTPGGGVVVEVKSAGVSFPELLQTRGEYQMKPDLPFVPGSEVGGIVRQVHGEARVKEGDRVAAFCMLGAWAQQAVAPTYFTFKIPDGWDFAQGAALVLNYHTAYFALIARGRLAEGETVVVHGAAGGVGTAAVQLAAAAGAHVTATVRRAEARDAVTMLGADEVIEPDGFEEHGPFDVILELVGAPNLAPNLKALAMQGRIVVIGIAAGAKGEVNLRDLMTKRATLRASMLRARPLEEKAQATRAVERHVLPLFADGKLRVPIAETFPLERAVEAYDRFAEGGKVGKIVVLTDGG
jgi:NADPH2:quinone reductase